MHLTQFFSSLFGRSNPVAENVITTLPDGCTFEACPDIEAVEPDDRPKQRTRRFEMVAYTGVEMGIRGWPHPIAVDLAGLAYADHVPIVLDHKTDSEFILGQTSSIRVIGGQLIVEGSILGVSRQTKEAVALADGGFRWQASIGVATVQGKTDFIPSGRLGEANGRQFKGPVYISRESQLREISFVSVGADQATRATIAAQVFHDWLTAGDWKPESLNDRQTSILRAVYLHEDAQNRQAAREAADGNRLAILAERQRIEMIHREFCGPANSQEDLLLAAEMIRNRTPENEVIKLALERARAQARFGL